jgi:hypothetical protein
MNNCYFAVQMLFFCSANDFFWWAEQIFWYAGKKNLSAQYKLLPQVCCLLAKVLPPCGTSFAALWQEF